MSSLFPLTFTRSSCPRKTATTHSTITTPPTRRPCRPQDPRQHDAVASTFQIPLTSKLQMLNLHRRIPSLLDLRRGNSQQTILLSILATPPHQVSHHLTPTPHSSPLLLSHLIPNPLHPPKSSNAHSSSPLCRMPHKKPQPTISAGHIALRVAPMKVLRRDRGQHGTATAVVCGRISQSSG